MELLCTSPNNLLLRSSLASFLSLRPHSYSFRADCRPVIQRSWLSTCVLQSPGLPGGPPRPGAVSASHSGTRNGRVTASRARARVALSRGPRPPSALSAGAGAFGVGAGHRGASRARRRTARARAGPKRPGGGATDAATAGPERSEAVPRPSPRVLPGEAAAPSFASSPGAGASATETKATEVREAWGAAARVSRGAGFREGAGPATPGWAELCCAESWAVGGAASASGSRRIAGGPPVAGKAGRASCLPKFQLKSRQPLRSALRPR